MKNTGIICGGCANDRHTAWQKANANKVIRKGSFVQIAVGLIDTDLVEHLWFKVLNVAGNIITGRCDNDPAYLPMKYGAVLEFDRSEIENYMACNYRNTLENT